MIEKTIGQLLDEAAETYPEQDALVYLDGPRYTYTEFKKACDRVAKGLLKLGIEPGDHVAVWGYNVPEWVILQFATAKIGAVLVTVNIYYKAHELEYLLKQSDAKALFLVSGFKDVDYVDTVYRVMPELRDGEQSDKLPYLEHVVFMGDERHEGMHTFPDVMDMGADVSDEALMNVQTSLDYHDTINMQYTSGTTGFPKGVELTHYNIVNNAYWVGRYLGLSSDDRMCIPVPFFHCFGCVMSTLNCVIYGAAMVPIEMFDAEQVLRAVDEEKCTVIQGVPTMFIRELDHPDFESYDTTSLRTGIMAGATCPMEVMKRVMDDMHVEEVTICYGLTEASPVITQTKRDDPIEKRVETVGTAHPPVDVKIIDPETGNEVPPGEPGELIARGYNIMKGYYKMPDATEETIEDGWLHTKDLAEMDEEGYIKIIGRVDDMIIRGGENVYPREIEEFLYTNPKIRDVAVVGVPHKEYGEEVAAFIQLREGETADEDDIKQFCRDNIARYKMPKYIFFVDEFPMTASGKIQKYKLRDGAEERLQS